MSSMAVAGRYPFNLVARNILRFLVGTIFASEEVEVGGVESMPTAAHLRLKCLARARNPLVGGLG